jgi:hypothetical protein
MAQLILIIVAVILGIFLMRFLGAWMMRINEVISLLEEIRDFLKKEDDHD